MRFFILLFSLFLTFPTFPTLADKSVPIEITPFAGYRFGGDFDIAGEFYGITELQELEVKIDDSSSYGVIIAWPFDNKRQGEILLSHYESELIPASLLTPYTSDLSVTYLHLGGNVPLSNGPVPFWLSGGFGITRFSPDEKQLDDETKLSVNLGFHSTLQLNKRIAIRLGARVYATFIDSDSAMFCDDNNCKIAVSSDLWLQSELSAGLTFTF
jgi:hypothetical protein